MVGELGHSLRDERLDRGAALVDAPTLHGVFDLLAVRPPAASALRSLHQRPIATAAMTVTAASFFGTTGVLA